VTETRTSLGREVGVVDIGSNSVRLVIYDVFGAHFTPIYNEKVLAGLGRALKKTGKLSEEGKSLTLQALHRFDRIAKARGLPPLIFGATAALRVAQDAPEFLDDIKTQTGMRIVPISGDEEARLSAMGLMSMHPRAKGLAADLGGASLELVEIGVRNTKDDIGNRQSLPLGPFDLIGDDLSNLTEEQIAKAKILIRQYLAEHKSLISKGKGKTLYLIGGAWRNLAAIHQSYVDYPLRTLQSYKLTPEIAQIHARWAYGDGRETVLNWPGMRKRRAETLPYSGLLLDVLIDEIKPKSVVISQSGLREGLVQNAIPEAQRNRDPLFDGCRAFAKGSLQTENFGRPLIRFIKPLKPLYPTVFNKSDDARIIKAACLMAGIGKDLHPDYRPEAIFAAVLYAPVAGLTHEERAFLALCLFRSYTSSRSVPTPNIIEALLTSEQRKVARMIGSTIRLAIVATGRSSELLDAFALSNKGTKLILEVEESERALLSDQVFFRLKKLAQKLGLEPVIN
jgi:exopolyphosphatase/guanosine-5'-triphosphate,3'-diphosphate pyrophosphatase